MALAHELKYQFRYALPLWLVSALVGWWPDNRLSVKVRGLLVSLVLRKCGKNLTLGRDVTLLAIDQLEIGDHVYFAKGTWINAIGGVTIEDEVIVAPYVVIASTNHGFKDGSARFGGAHPAPIRIGRGSWLGSHATITAGVTVGKGNLIGAQSVVTKDTPDHVFAGGVPAKVIGPREDNPSDITSRTQFTEAAPTE